MSYISNSFKTKAGLKFAQNLNIDDENTMALIVKAWKEGFNTAESMFVEQD